MPEFENDDTQNQFDPQLQIIIDRKEQILSKLGTIDDQMKDL